MIDPSARPESPLRILHVLRAPDDGCLRAITALVQEQAGRGHPVGLVIDHARGDADVERRLAGLSSGLALGLHRMPMARAWRPRDLGNILEVSRIARRSAADVMHGHGRKGGFYVRGAVLPRGGAKTVACYTPHGGYPKTGAGATPRMSLVERIFAARTDLFLFESLHLANRYHRCADAGGAVVRIVPTGIAPGDFTPIHADAEAADFLFVGDLEAGSGLEGLVDAVAILGRRLARPVGLAIVGAGPLEGMLAARARERGIAENVRFLRPRPARHAFALGRILVVPGGCETLPSVILEAAGAQVPILATDTGGIGEIFGPYRDRLISSANTIPLAIAMERALQIDPEHLASQACDLANFASSRFTTRTMTDSVIAGYREALARRAELSTRFPHPVPVSS